MVPNTWVNGVKARLKAKASSTMQMATFLKVLLKPIKRTALEPTRIKQDKNTADNGQMTCSKELVAKR